MKKLSAFLLTLVFVFSLSACVAMPNKSNTDSNLSQQSSTPDVATELTRDQAIDIALKEVGVSKEDVFGLEAETDYENGVKVWQVDFDYENKEYSYDINITTGEIVERDKDLDY